MAAGLSDLRQTIDSAIADGAVARASLAMADLWRSDPSLATAGFLLPRYEQLRAGLQPQRWRVALLRSFTVEPLMPLLRAAGFAAGLDVEVHAGEFNAHAQELLDPESTLYRFNPDTLFLAVRTPDIAPELWHAGDLTAEAITAICRRVTTEYRQWLTIFRSKSQAAVVVHGLEQPFTPASGLLDRVGHAGQTSAIARLNDEIAGLCREFRGVYFLDYEALIARHGRRAWHDERRWLAVRLPIAGPHLIDVVREWMRFLHPLTGRVAKALVVDLDNTLWSGVIGEDGMTGIRLGREHPGAAFRALQQAMLDLRQRGILLAICSKNNLDDAREVLDHHPEMLVRAGHFAAMRINWNDKAANLREIAAELNIGVDALAFLDDNPVERELVRQRLPEVAVLDAPADPMRYAGLVRDCPLFERLTLSAEDRQRGDMYAAQHERAELEKTVASREEFLRSLDQEAEVAPVSPATLARVAQLTQKTNQFNLTTRRYSEQDIAQIAARPGWRVLSISVKDRYGDNGLVGVAITSDTAQTCDVDTFLLSCRVIARSVETALLGVIAEQARGRGCRCLRGVYAPTKKNAPCRDFYASHGFAQVGAEGDATTWELDLSASTVASPPWIRVLLPQAAS